MKSTSASRFVRERVGGQLHQLFLCCKKRVTEFVVCHIIMFVIILGACSWVKSGNVVVVE